MEFAENIELNSSAVVGQDVTLTYHGFLSESSELTIVYGFGESWNHTTEAPMTKTSSGFVAKINMMDFDTFHFCFRNANYEWDNNDNRNYTCAISPSSTPEESVQKFDIDALIEEILEPIIAESKIETSNEVQISEQPIDLGVEISNILSQISTEAVSEDLVEYSTLDEILTCTVIEETPIDLFETQANDIEETSLINVEDSFMISSRKLSKFYLFRKHLKLSLYKLLMKLPNLIFGSEEQ